MFTFAELVEMVFLGWAMMEGKKELRMVASFLSANISFPIHPSTTRPRYAPTLLTDTNTGDKIELIHIECGGNHTVGLTKNGQVVSWGCNDYGQLGHGDEKERRVPTKVKALDGRVIIKVSCGAFHTVAITDKGELLTWYVQS
jgi:alpha-tubulin suppressor-like RCC1 family protein